MFGKNGMQMMAAAQQCKDRGCDLGSYERQLDDLFNSKIEWREILRQFLTPMFDSTKNGYRLIEDMYTRRCIFHP